MATTAMRVGTKLVKPMPAPLDGLVLNIPSELVSDGSLLDCQNIRYKDNAIIKRTGYEPLGIGLPLNGAVMGIFLYTVFTGTQYTLFITTRDVYSYDPIAQTYAYLTPQYNSGTVTVTNGSTTITGAGTSWTTTVKIGDQFRIGGLNDPTPVWYTVSTINSNTSITLTAPYAGTGEAGQAYCIRKLLQGTDSNPVFTAVFAGYFIFTNGVDVPMAWNTVGQIAPLAGNPPVSQYLLVFGNYLILANTIEGGTNFPQRVRWCDTGDPTKWASGNAGYDNSFINSDTPISGLEVLQNGYLAVYKTDCIWLGYPTNQTPNIFDFYIASTDNGNIAPASIQVIGNNNRYASSDNVYDFNGSDTPLPLADVIQTAYMNNLNGKQVGKMLGVYIHQDNEYMLFYPQAASLYNNAVWILNTKTGRWLQSLFFHNITAFGRFQTQASVTWDEAQGTWNTSIGAWQVTKFLSLSPILLFGDENGYVYSYDYLSNNDAGNAINAYFTTKDFMFDRFDIMKEVVRMDVWAMGNSLTVDYSTDEGSTWTIGFCVIALDPTRFLQYKVDLRVQCQKIRFRFSNANLGEFFSFKGWTIYYIERGRMEA